MLNNEFLGVFNLVYLINHKVDSYGKSPTPISATYIHCVGSDLLRIATWAACVGWVKFNFLNHIQKLVILQSPIENFFENKLLRGF